VSILTGEAPGQFLGVGLAHEMRARVQQPLHNRRRARRGLVGAEPVGAAEARLVARDVVDILNCKREPREWPVRRTLNFDMGIAAEGSEPVIDNDFVHSAVPCSNQHVIIVRKSYRTIFLSKTSLFYSHPRRKDRAERALNFLPSL
jgi:hypothetical protein